MKKYILGIETSCDDTSVALVDVKGNVLGIETVNQDHLLNQYGGVYPEFASRAHQINIIPAIDKLILDSGISIDEDIEAIAVTRGPGLIGALIIGIHTAESLGLVWNKKVIGINHLRGHLASVELEQVNIELPSIVLLVSGGHTFISYVDEDNKIELLGETRDDSLGEAYDKVGRMLGIEFPAGPKIDKLAVDGVSNIKFPTPLINEGFEFSFSGLKSSVSRYLNHNDGIVVEDICSSFVDSVIKVLDKKLRKALSLKVDTKTLVLVGGVSASKQIRDLATKISLDNNVKVALPPIKWATDNGAMIAMAGWDYLKNDKIVPALPQARIPLKEY